MLSLMTFHLDMVFGIESLKDMVGSGWSTQPRTRWTLREVRKFIKSNQFCIDYPAHYEIGDLSRESAVAPGVGSAVS